MRGVSTWPFWGGVLLAAQAAALAPAQAAGDIYISSTASGLPVYSSDANLPGGRLYLSIADPPPRPKVPRESDSRLPLTSGVPWSARSLQHAGAVELAEVAAAAYGVPKALLLAVMHAESAFNPEARSSAGALGLMQVMPDTGRRYGVRSGLTDPATNVDVGARYLRDLLKLFGGNKELAVAAYNAGEGAVIKHGWRVPPYAETRAYVPKVMVLYKRYAGG